MVWWEALRIVLYYWSDAGRLALAMSEAARKSYKEVISQTYWRFLLVVSGVAICIYALASEPKETRICTKCCRSVSSLPKDIKLCPYCGNQLQRVRTYSRMLSLAYLFDDSSVTSIKPPIFVVLGYFERRYLQYSQFVTKSNRQKMGLFLEGCRQNGTNSICS